MLDLLPTFPKRIQSDSQNFMVFLGEEKRKRESHGKQEGVMELKSTSCPFLEAWAAPRQTAAAQKQ
jgi:hypothetical protein